MVLDKRRRVDQKTRIERVAKSVGRETVHREVYGSEIARSTILKWYNTPFRIRTLASVLCQNRTPHD